MMNATSVSSFWQARPRLVNNPVILRELVVRLRKKSSFVFLLCLVGVAGIAFLLFYPILIQSYTQGRRPGGFSTQEVFVLMSLLQGISILIVMPLFASTCINLEREQQTWDLLITTPINISSILLGKYLSSILFSLILLVSLIPIVGLTIPMGGVSPQEILFIFSLLLELVLTAGVLGMYCSIRWKRTVQSVSFTYGSIVLLYVVLPTLIMMNYSPSNQPLGPLIFVSPLMIAIQYLGNESLFLCSNTAALTIHGALAVCILLAGTYLCYRELNRQSGKPESQSINWRFSFLRYFSLPFFFSYIRRINKYLLQSSSPLHEKEIKDYLGESDESFVKSQLWIFAAGLLLLPVGLANANDPFEYYYALCLYAGALLIPCLVVPFGANVIRSENDRETWLLLITTTLSPQKIFAGKYHAGFHLLLARVVPFLGIPLFVAIVQAFSSLLLNRGIENILCNGKNLIVVFFILLAFVFSARSFLSGCMWVSTLFARTTHAYAIAFFCTALVLIGPSIVLLISDAVMGTFFGFPWYILLLLAVLSPFHLLIHLSHWNGSFELEFIFRTLIATTKNVTFFDWTNGMIICIHILWMIRVALFFEKMTIRRLRKVMNVE